MMRRDKEGWPREEGEIQGEQGRAEERRGEGSQEETRRAEESLEEEWSGDQAEERKEEFRKIGNPPCLIMEQLQKCWIIRTIWIEVAQ